MSYRPDGYHDDQYHRSGGSYRHPHAQPVAAHHTQGHSAYAHQGHGQAAHVQSTHVQSTHAQSTYGHSSHPHAHHGHAHHGHAHRAPRTTRAQPRAGEHSYTLAHHGRQIRLGPVAFWICVISLVLMATWSGVTATYFAFRDDVLTRLIARQAKMQYDYEDRLAELRAQVDRTVSRQLIDQDQVEKKLDAMLRRQAVLEKRASALAALPETGDITGSISPARHGTQKPTAMPKPSPLSGTGLTTPASERGASLSLRGGRFALASDEASSNSDTIPEVNRLQTSLDRVEHAQIAALGAIGQNLELRAHRMRGVFADLGLDATRMMSRIPAAGKGGPFVPARPSASASDFDRQLYKINLARAQTDRLARTLVHVPYRKPIPGELDLSSGFGLRVDPFLGRPAMHTGLDFRGDTGDPVRATADGVVETAGWAGGYGRMIEIDHGNGLSTRYGHLSAINVKPGQRVHVGQVIGEIGSTGRSTGPHLHYETRIKGEAVNPQKFLRAGQRLGQT